MLYLFLFLLGLFLGFFLHNKIVNALSFLDPLHLFTQKKDESSNNKK